ncbi:MAG: trypsin-like peptidase domain-containing protein [Nitriliruptoraceae bacterium]
MGYDRDEWRRPWRTSDDAPVGAATVAGSERVIARFPQPPPTGWSDRAAGPGSPAGSVRPPDTVGTVEAPASPRRRRPVGLVLGTVLGAAFGTLGTLWVTGVLPEAEEDTAAVGEAEDAAETVNAPVIEPLTQGSIVPAVAEAVTPSVVRIDVRARGEDGEDGSGPGGQSGLGSGVIYRSDGYIITNHHVVERGGTVEVRLASGDVLPAEIVGSDELNDIAVVRIDADDLPAINIRAQDEPLIVGETVIAIGSPFGLDASVTAGVISALNRELRLDEQNPGEGVLTIPSIVQTDAAINPGNSGGALVDAQGRLVGINTAILSGTGANQGVGFAVPAAQAVESADQLIEQGFVRHALLGIAGRDISAEDAESLGLPDSRGAIIETVQEGTGAAEVGLRPGDVIMSVDGEPLATMSELVAAVRDRSPGDIVELEVFRDGEEFDLEVELSERPR